MAGGGIVGYEPVPGQPDALNFKTGDGRLVMAFGPEAAAMKQRIDSTPRPLFAGPGAAGYEDASAGMSVPGEPPAGGMSPNPGPPQQASAPPAAASPSQAAAPAGAPSPTGDLGAYLTGKVYVPGSKGVSQAELQKRSTQGVATPKSASVGTEGWFTPNADYLENAANLSVDERLLHQQNTDAQAAEANGLADLYRSQYAQNAAKEAAAAKQAAALQAGVSQQQAKLTEARQAFATSKVDPDRIFSGEDGGFQKLSAVIGAGLGAWAATIGRTPNFALDIINNRINRDVAAQEAEIRVKGENAQNALQDLIRQTGDMETAKSALHIIQQDQASRMINAFAADSKSQQIKQAAAEWDVQHQQSLNEKLEDYRQKSIGKVTQQIQQEMLYPKAGSAGHYRDATDADVARRVGIAKGVQDIGASKANVANTEADTALKGAQAQKTAGEAAAGPDDTEFTKTARETVQAKSQIENMLKQYGYGVKDGKIVATSDKAGFPTRFNMTGSSTLGQQLSGLGIGFAGIVNGGRELGEEAKKQFIPAATDTDASIISKLQAQYDTISAREDAAKATADPRAVRVLEQRQAGRGSAIRAQAESGGGAGGDSSLREE